MARPISRRQAALVTGGAKRIGRHLALYLAKKGYDIALHYHTSTSEASRTAAHVRRQGVRCETFAADLTIPAASEALLPQARQTFPRLSLLVNNASLFLPSALLRTSPEMFDQFFAIHVRTPFVLATAFARTVQRGHIINILDTRVAGLKTGHAVYLLSKKALKDLTLLAAKEFAPRIRVNAIAPGLILPPPGEDAAYLKKRAQSVPLTMTGSPADLTRAADYLIDSPFVTGQILYQDGGEHLL